jgi:hypothetical protein
MNYVDKIMTNERLAARKRDPRYAALTDLARDA